MSYQIRLVPEVEQWLSEIRLRDPAAADRIDAALAALRAGGESVGPPLVMPFDDPGSEDMPASMQAVRTLSSGSGLHMRLHKPGRRKQLPAAGLRSLARIGSKSALADLDAAYQQQLATLARVRRAVGTAATSRKQLEMKVEELKHQILELGSESRSEREAFPDKIGDGEVSRGALERQLADVRIRYEKAQADEQRLGIASQRFQARLGEYAAAKESIETAYMAAREAADAAWAEVTGTADANADAAPLGVARAERVQEARPERVAPPLSELRPGAPESTGIRILFVVEPAGTAVVLAGGMLDDWLQAWYDEARTLCHARYEQSRASKR